MRNNRYLAGSLLTFAIAIACAKKPAQSLPPGTTDNLYEKSKFDNKEYVVGQADGEVEKFIDAARNKTRPAVYNLLAQDSGELKNGDRVVFKINYDLDLILMYPAGSENPIAQWNIRDHCALQTQKNAKNEDTRFIEAKCSDGRDNKSFDRMKLTFASVTTGYDRLPVDAERYVPAATIKGGQANLTQDTGAPYTITCNEYSIKGEALTRARELVLDPSFKEFNSLKPCAFTSTLTDLVNFQGSLLPEVVLLGEKGKSYGLRVMFTDHTMLVQKVTTQEGVASSEKTYAINLGNGKFAVTLAGYPIATLKLVNAISNGHKTAELNPVLAEGLKEATHVKVSTTLPVPFNAVEKLDVFPTSFFADGSEWFYEKSVVDRKLDGANNTTDENAELGIQIVSGRVRVHKTKASMQLVDVNTPEQAKNVQGDQMQSLLEIPARWVDYRVDVSGSGSQMIEREIGDSNPQAEQWDKRKFANFEFNRADHLSDARSDQLKLLRLEISDNYVGFSVYESASQVTYMYSLVRAKEKTNPGRIYFANDRKTFGFFPSLRNYYNGTTTQYEDVKEEKVTLSRMYPEVDAKSNEPTIYYYITENSPDEEILQNAVQKAVDAWDATFVQAAQGTGKPAIRVKLGKNRVALGDVRYNKVAFHGYDRSTITPGLMGYGPSVKDRRNGEIFNATNHIYLRNYREGVWSSLNSYIRLRLGQYESSKLKGLDDVIPNQQLALQYGLHSNDAAGAVSNLSFVSNEVPANGSKTNNNPFLTSTNNLEMFGSSFGEEKPTYLYRSPISYLAKQYVKNPAVLAEKNFGELTAGVETATDLIDVEAYSTRARNNPEVWNALSKGTCSYGAANANTVRDIELNCMGENSKAPLFRDYVNKLLEMSKTESRPVTHISEEEEAAFTSCSNIILENKLIATLVHEFGHNFGMSHNFAASSDLSNFPRDKDGNIKFLTASVMDYPDSDDDRDFEPGTYDLAAIRYGYYDAIEAQLVRNQANASARLLKLEGKSIDKALAAERAKTGETTLIEKPYKFCWDMDILPDEAPGQMPLTDPFCRRWDRGTSAVELAKNLIDGMNAYLVTQSHRFDRENITSVDNITENIINRFLIPLKIIYDHYRFKLKEEVADARKDQYFSKLTDQAEVEALVAQGSAELKDFYKASHEVIYPFLKKLVFSPVNYCVLVGTKGEEKFYNLQQIRNDIYYKTKVESGVGLEVSSCADAKDFLIKNAPFAVADYRDVGNIYDDLTFSPDPAQSVGNRPDIVRGLRHARNMAMVIITARASTSGVAMLSKFTPSMVDEPQFLQDLATANLERVVLGESKGKIFDDKARDNEYFPSFFQEKDLFLGTHKALLASANPPGFSGDKAEFMKAWVRSGPLLRSLLNLKPEQNLETALRSAGFVWIQDTSSNYYLGHQEYFPFAYRLIEVLNKVEASKPSDLVKNQQEVEEVLAFSMDFIKATDKSYRDLIAAGGEVPTVENHVVAALNAAADAGVAKVNLDFINSFMVNAMGIKAENGRYKLGFSDPAQLDAVFLPGMQQILNNMAAAFLAYDENRLEYDSQREILRTMILNAK